MDRDEVVSFILSEAARLTNEEHVVDLAKAGRYDELKDIEIHVTRQVYEFFHDNKFRCNPNKLLLDTEDIPEGMFLAVAMIFNIIGSYNDLDINDTITVSFAEKLALEAGDLGKNIAALMQSAENLHEINSTEFFSDAYADEYEEYEDNGED